MTEQNGSAERPQAAPPGVPSPQEAVREPAAAGDSAAVASTGADSAAPGSAGDVQPGRTAGSKGPTKLNELVDQPAKVMRIGTMIKQLLEEVRNAPLDDAARNRLAEIHERSLKELEDGLAPELVSELHRINLPFTDDATPTDAELRIAQAQLVGWLEGLFRGIQTAIAAQQTASLGNRLQVRQLPPGMVLAPGVVIGEDGEPRRSGGAGRTDPSHAPEPHAGPGQYL